MCSGVQRGLFVGRSLPRGPRRPHSHSSQPSTISPAVSSTYDAFECMMSLSGSSLIDVRRCSIASSKRPTCAYAIARLLRAGRRALRQLERVLEAHDGFGKVAEQALRVAEQRPEVHVGVPAELDATAQRRVGAAQPTEVVEHFAEHRVVRSVLGRERDRAPQRRDRFVVALAVLEHLAEVVPRVPAAAVRRRRSGGGSLRPGRSACRVAARSRSCCRSRRCARRARRRAARRRRRARSRLRRRCAPRAPRRGAARRRVRWRRGASTWRQRRSVSARSPRPCAATARVSSASIETPSVWPRFPPPTSASFRAVGSGSHRQPTRPDQGCGQDSGARLRADVDDSAGVGRGRRPAPGQGPQARPGCRRAPRWPGPRAGGCGASSASARGAELGRHRLRREARRRGRDRRGRSPSSSASSIAARSASIRSSAALQDVRRSCGAGCVRDEAGGFAPRVAQRNEQRLGTRAPAPGPCSRSPRRAGPARAGTARRGSRRRATASGRAT